MNKNPVYDVDRYCSEASRSDGSSEELVEEFHGLIYDSLESADWSREHLLPAEIVVYDAWEFDMGAHGGFHNLVYLSEGGELFARGHSAFKEIGGVFYEQIDHAKEVLESLDHDFSLPLRHENGFVGEGEQDWSALEDATKPFDDAYWAAKDIPNPGEGLAIAILDYIRRYRDELTIRRA